MGGDERGGGGGSRDRTVCKGMLVYSHYNSMYPSGLSGARNNGIRIPLLGCIPNNYDSLDTYH